MKTKKETINEQEFDVLFSKKGYLLQIKAEFSNTGEAIPVGNKVVLGINHWVTESPVQDSEKFYEEIINKSE